MSNADWIVIIKFIVIAAVAVGIGKWWNRRNARTGADQREGSE